MGWARFLALVALATLLSVENRPPESAPRYVLIWKDAWLYADAREDAEHARREVWAPRSRDEHLGEVFVARLWRDQGEFLEVEPLTGESDQPQCAEGLKVLHGFRIHVFVHRADLAPATVREAVWSYPDGTGVRLAAGIPVGPPSAPEAGSAFYALTQDSLRLTTRLRTEDVGFVFPAPQMFSVRSGWLVDTEQDLALGNGYAKWSFGCPRPAQLIGRRGGRALARVADGCVDLQVLLPVEQLREAKAGMGCGENCLCDYGGREVGVRAGAALYWGDGRLAGSATSEASLWEPVLRGKRLCIERWLSKAEPGLGELTLCVDEADTYRAKVSQVGMSHIRHKDGGN